MQRITRIEIAIDCENAAFHPYAKEEVARILRELATDLAIDLAPEAKADHNGNRVCAITYTYADCQENES